MVLRARPHADTSHARHPVAASVLAAVLLALVLTLPAVTLPLRQDVDHAAGHVALGLPALFLLVLARHAWPEPTSRASRIARFTLLTGLGVTGLALLLEAIGAFGYGGPAGYDAVNGLATVHDIAVPFSPLGIVLAMVGAILSIGVGLAARKGAERSRIVTWAVVLAVVAAVAFVAGGLVFGY